MDVSPGLTKSGTPCKKCGKSPGNRCSQHLKSASKKSTLSPKRMPENVFTKLDCNILLKIAEKVDPQDFLNFSLVSREIDNCISDGRYKTSNKEETRRKRLELKNMKRDLARRQMNSLNYWRF